MAVKLTRDEKSLSKRAQRAIRKLKKRRDRDWMKQVDEDLELGQRNLADLTANSTNENTFGAEVRVYKSSGSDNSPVIDPGC